MRNATIPDTDNLPYHPGHFHVGGVYLLRVGNLFYVGSGSRLGSRLSDHKARLERGDHRIEALQDEFTMLGELTFTILKLVARKPKEPDADYKRRRLMWEQVALNRVFGTPGCVNASSNSGFNTGIGEVMREKWKNPVFREATVARMKQRRGDAISAETRAKMAEAKTGARNPKSCPCFTVFEGFKKNFDSASEAARYHGVSQQLMQQWLSGAVAWPGSGPRTPRTEKGRELIGLTGAYR